MSPSEQHEQAELKWLIEHVPPIMPDRVTGEKVFNVLCMIDGLWQQHQVDARDRCEWCRPQGRRIMLRRRQSCEVRAMLNNWRLTSNPDDPTQQLR